jgi:putative oxidoreductase
MSLANPLWGAPRIHGELLKLGIEIAQSTIAKYMARHGRGPSQTWKTLLHNHAAGVAAMDFLIVPTIGFKLLFVLGTLRHQRRRLISLRVTSNPTAEWIALLAIPLRLGAAVVFWNSAMTKLPNWETTVTLFADEYQVPLLPPEAAASMATAIELTMPVLLVLGLLTRPAALVLLGMTAVIQMFVYPLAWSTHLQWAAMLLVLLARGPGTFSLDWLIRRRLIGDG